MKCMLLVLSLSALSLRPAEAFFGFGKKSKKATVSSGSIPAHYSKIAFPEFRYEPPHPDSFRVRLQGGATAFLVRDTTFDLLHVDFFFPRPFWPEKPAEAAALDLYGSLLKAGGTRRFSPEQLEDSLEFVAASLSAQLSDYTSGLSLSSLSKYGYPLLELFPEVALEPRLDPEIFRQNQKSFLESIRHRFDSPGDVAALAYEKVLYGSHPTNWLPTEEELKRVRPADLRRFKGRGFSPEGLVIGVSGNFKKEEMVRNLEALLAKWPQGEGRGPKGRGDGKRKAAAIRKDRAAAEQEDAAAEAVRAEPASAEGRKKEGPQEEAEIAAEGYGKLLAEDPAPPAAAGLDTLEPPFPGPLEPGVYLVDKKVSQATLRLGAPGVRRPHPDYYRLSVASYIFGSGGFSSRLVTKVRSDEGLAYDVDSYATSDYYRRGTVGVALQTKVETAPYALKLCLDEMERMAKEGITDAELEKAKDGLVKSLPSLFDTPRATAQIFAQSEIWKRDPDHFKNYVQEIRALSKDEVNDAFRRYFRRDSLRMVVVGPEAQLLQTEPKSGAKLADFGKIRKLSLKDIEKKEKP